MTTRVARRAAGENFPVALNVLPRRIRHDLMAVYGFARHVDDLGDEADGDRVALLGLASDELDRVYGGTPRSPVFRSLQQVVRTHDLPKQPFADLVEANRLDQRVRRYQTIEDLHGYCALSANPVGRIVLHLAGVSTPDRITWSDDVCTALQILEHLQDVGEDHRNGRVYLPADDMARFDVSEQDLAARSASPRLRSLVAFEAARATTLLDSGTPLVRGLTGWARIAVAGYVAGGRATVRALRRAEHDVLARHPRPARAVLLAELVRLLTPATDRSHR